MLAFRHPSKDGTVLFLDCEGGGNNNQTAIPFVVALAARLANRIYVFERGCFTTAGLDVVMQIMNMGYVTTTHAVEIPRSLVLVENMSINQEIEEEELLEDLLCEEEGDEITNRVRQLIKERFDVEFQKIPFHTLGVPTMHQQAIEVMGDVLADRLAPIALGNVPMDGKMIAHLVNELLAQVRNGGTRFNMTTVTEAMVANMATDAANTIWEGFVSRLRRTGNHPSQINGRKPLPQIMQEVESAANTAIDELEGFVNRLVPSEPAVVAKTIWERNYQHLESSIQATYRQKLHERSQEKTWFEHITAIVNELVQQIVDLVWQIFRMLQTSIRVISFSNRLLLGGSGLLSSISASAAPARSNGGLFGALTQAAGFRLGAPSMFSL
ncbi:uncharacterized protein BJ171DRAFT_418838 [Polychytrium aggregatum]|uniref:uncharacterized protein n=1 Tax=Polychytrium aggregatum TaxID=110093 RepID=UPI0022FE524B|nr:uncharacterized protein BJ171DRAFT_418838 [Polychytrium aggregatum]KAI9209437.1 hypothetical protein BJ171DRAFT_418838 [Polychytrium aggregatum]